jgi:hypothetical protein
MHNSGAFKGYEMMKTITGRIPIGAAGLFHAFGHHLSGGIFVVRFLFFFFFTFKANGLMVDNRQDPAFLDFQKSAAPTACFST